MADKKNRNHEQPDHEHRPEEIRRRLSEQEHSYVGDAILGAVDGGVTTFAVIAGAVGGGFESRVIVILGFAKLVADGFSMATSNFLRANSEHDRIEEAREIEHAHIRDNPKGEREEIRQIYARKGFEEETLDEIVETICADEERWVEVMLREELGLNLEAPNAWTAAGATFGAFLLVGLVPLVPFLLPMLSLVQATWASAVVTAFVFLLIGLVKGLFMNRPVLRSGLQTLLMGSSAAAIAYFVSNLLRQRFGV